MIMSSFLCLFEGFFLSHSRTFHSYGGINITGEGLQILTYAGHLRPLSSEGSLACHTYCDMRHLFTMVISEDLWHSHLIPSVLQWSYHHLFLRFRSVAAVFLIKLVYISTVVYLKDSHSPVNECIISRSSFYDRTMWHGLWINPILCWLKVSFLMTNFSSGSHLQFQRRAWCSL